MNKLCWPDFENIKLAHFFFSPLHLEESYNETFTMHLLESGFICIFICLFRMQAIKARFNDIFKLVFTFSNRDFHPCGEKIKNNCN